MIQVGTFLNVCDNSGAKKVCCIDILPGSKNRYSFIGDIILVSIKSLRKRRKKTSKVKKGDVIRALVVKTKSGLKTYSGEYNFFFENSVVLLSKQNKMLGTRILSPLLKRFRFTKFFKLISLSLGVL